jgi:hypothetical protein
MLTVFMLNVVMLSVIMPSVVVLSVIMLNVMAPLPLHALHAGCMACSVCQNVLAWVILLQL